MKKNLLTIFSFILLNSFAFGQTFSDDFESYGVGDYLAQSSPNWTTWGGTVGTSEDIRITDEAANSGTKSIKFVGVGTGGPQDVVLYYGGQKLTTGFLNTKMSLNVETGAYFNYQAEVAIGTTWAMNAFFEEGGAGRITNAANQTILTFNYPYGEWFDFEMNINFDINKWQLNVNGICVGSFANDNNSIASIDLYPVTGNSFFVDDFSYDYSPISPEVKEDISTAVNVPFTSGLAGTVMELSGILTNEGTTMVNSFEVDVTVGSEVIPYSETGLALMQGEKHEFVIDNAFVLPAFFTQVELDVKSVNGGNFTDEDLCNNEASALLFGTEPREHKRVVVEEATGTWCGWCPRGTVWMDRMSNKYPDHFIGIAVHNGDPMADPDYDSGLGAPAYPNALVNRGSFIDPANIEAPFLTQVQESSAAIMQNGALWDADTRELTISLEVTSLEDISTDHRVNIALTEDGVTGTSNQYGQVNYYSASSDLIDDNGMNWRDLPATVPAADMVYDHVARAILAPYAGMENSFEDDLSVNGTKVFNFSYTVPMDFDEDNMHIVTMLINPNGTINTGASTTIANAVANGFLLVSSTHSVELGNATNIYPNPMNDYTTVDINLVERTDVRIEIMDLAGKSSFLRTYEGQNGFFRANVNTSNLPAGTYIMKINTNDLYTTKKISVVR